jgi:NAD(P)-dependent dehydrogenase (short-subunit alcohol dehydrogenase family)
MAYAAEGARVVVSDVRKQEGEETVRLIRASEGNALFVKSDVIQSSQMADLVATAEREYGALHIMTANAGILGAASSHYLADISEDDFWHVINVNLGGVFNAFKHAIPAILRAGGGAMTATGSLGGHLAAKRLSAYGSSKAAVSQLVRVLALELSPTIRVNEVAPGGMVTEILAHQAEELGVDPPSPPYRSTSGSFVEPRDVALLHLFLVSDEGASVNGQRIFADAGRSIVMAPGI